MKGPNHVLVGHFTFPNIPNTISLQFEEKKKKKTIDFDQITL